MCSCVYITNPLSNEYTRCVPVTKNSNVLQVFFQTRESNNEELITIRIASDNSAPLRAQ